MSVPKRWLQCGADGKIFCGFISGVSDSACSLFAFLALPEMPCAINIPFYLNELVRVCCLSVT